MEGKAILTLCIVFTLAIVVLLLSINNNSKKTKTRIKKEKKKKVSTTFSQDELDFVSSATDRYHHDICYALFGEDRIISARYTKVKKENKFYLQVEINYESNPLVANCFINGHTDIYYRGNVASFEGFTIENLTQALKKIGIIEWFP